MQPKFNEIEIESARNVSIHGLLKLRNNGRRISICCPFPDHNDSTPSFALYPNNSAHCFGCPNGGWHGHNAIDFTMRLLGVDFHEAVKELLNYNID